MDGKSGEVKMDSSLKVRIIWGPLVAKCSNLKQARATVCMQIIVGVSFQFHYFIFLVEDSVFKDYFLRNDHMSCCHIILEYVCEKMDQ